MTGFADKQQRTPGTYVNRLQVPPISLQHDQGRIEPELAGASLAPYLYVGMPASGTAGVHGATNDPDRADVRDDAGGILAARPALFAADGGNRRGDAALVPGAGRAARRADLLADFPGQPWACDPAARAHPRAFPDRAATSARISLAATHRRVRIAVFGFRGVLDPPWAALNLRFPPPLPPRAKRVAGRGWGWGVAAMPRARKVRKVDGRIPRARHLRRSMTDAERKLWRHLRALLGKEFHFRRQATIGPYFVDFACHQAGSSLRWMGVSIWSASGQTLRGPRFSIPEAIACCAFGTMTCCS